MLRKLLSKVFLSLSRCTFTQTKWRTSSSWGQSFTNTQIQTLQQQFSTSKTLKTKSQCLSSASDRIMMTKISKITPASSGKVTNLILKATLRTQVSMNNNSSTNVLRTIGDQFKSNPRSKLCMKMLMTLVMTSTTSLVWIETLNSF